MRGLESNHLSAIYIFALKLPGILESTCMLLNVKQKIDAIITIELMLYKQ